MPGLDFLSKKSWHTSNLANQEKVWLAEQRKAEEERRTRELMEQIQLERQEEELRKLTNSKSHTKLDKGIDWMYNEGGGKQIEPEDYLLGKTFTGENLSQQLLQGKTDEMVSAVAESIKVEENIVSTVASATASAEPLSISAADRNEEFRLRQEDPMYLVHKRKQLQLDELRRKKDLLERVTGKEAVLVVKHPKTTENVIQEHVEKKKSRHDMRKHSRKHRYSDSEDESYDRTRRHRRRRRRSHNNDDDEDDDDDSYRRTRRTRRRRSSDSSTDESRSKSDSRRRRHRSRRNSPPSKRSDSHHKQKSASFREHDNHQKSELELNHPKKRDGFGLQGHEQIQHEFTTLGPDKELLDKKRKERQDAKSRYKSNSHQFNLTEEQRQARIRQMAADAAKREALLKK